ncbi:uncharacterized protein LOC143793913 [Ranitomeya variabilis]|uniref:uncharacterized protein LOC143793913 n=1 Tax=Ranitomeya variabilis TaxID=490064 RepID=UPI00405695F1
MHWAVLFLLTVYLTYSSAQFTVIQDGPISVSPGGSVRLTCSLSTGNVGGGNVPNWIYQILGSVPKLVIGSSGASNQNYRPSWTSDRFTGSITGGSAVLSVSKVEIGDTGDYYCAVWSDSSAQFTVIQDGPISSVSPGGSVRLTCSLSTGNVGGGNLPNWIYQILGSVPKLVIGSSGTTNQNYRPSWTSDRFTGSITGGSAVLSISKVEIGDTGDYYCAVWSGTQCTVVQKIQNTDTYTSSLLYILKT